MLILAILKLLLVVVAVYFVIFFDIKKVKQKITIQFKSGNRRTRYTSIFKDHKKLVEAYGDFVLDYQVSFYVVKKI